MRSYPNVKRAQLQKLMLHGFVKERTKNEYEDTRLYHASKRAHAVLFTSGKLVLQGNDLAIEYMEKLLVKIGVIKKTSLTKSTGTLNVPGIIIGSDETLKGDTFGGLIVAAVRADDEKRRRLDLLKVTDSKLINDKTIPLMAKRIKEFLGAKNYCIMSLMPEEYNNNQDLTKMLNIMHKDCGVKLKALGSAIHIVDKYPGCTVGDMALTKAESKYVEVAAASVLARDEGLRQLKQLSKELGFEVPKGSTHVKSALAKLRKLSEEKDINPAHYVKMHFRNVKAVFKKK